MILYGIAIPVLKISINYEIVSKPKNVCTEFETNLNAV